MNPFPPRHLPPCNYNNPSIPSNLTSQVPTKKKPSSLGLLSSDLKDVHPCSWSVSLGAQLSLAKWAAAEPGAVLFFVESCVLCWKRLLLCFGWCSHIFRLESCAILKKTPGKLQLWVLEALSWMALGGLQLPKKMAVWSLIHLHNSLSASNNTSKVGRYIHTICIQYMYVIYICVQHILNYTYCYIRILMQRSITYPNSLILQIVFSCKYSLWASSAEGRSCGSGLGGNLAICLEFFLVWFPWNGWNWRLI